MKTNHSRRPVVARTPRTAAADLIRGKIKANQDTIARYHGLARSGDPTDYSGHIKVHSARIRQLKIDLDRELKRLQAA